MRRPLLILSVLLTILALNGSTQAGQPARINITPWGYARPPVTLSIIAHIDRDSHNRGASIVLMSDTYYSESDVDLDGDRAPFLIRREVRGLGVGTYQAFLELRQWTGSSWKSQTFHSEKLEVVD